MIAGLRRYEINKIRQDLRGWYNRPCGQLLLEEERRQLDEILSTLFGFHILQIGCLLGNDLMAASRVSHRVLLDPDIRGNETLAPGVFAYPDALPIASDSVDVVLLPHTLEFERDPHQILREVDRILIPEGYVVVLGFNPRSLWGVVRKLRGRKGRAPWCGDFLTMARIKDWVALLGFDVVSVRRHFYRPPVNNRVLMNRMRVLEKIGPHLWSRLSGAYILVAQKRVATLTPLKPRWRPQRSLAGGLVGSGSQSTSSTKECRMKGSSN